jgi:TonB-linked SusC/RagA family outer membrane protein
VKDATDETLIGVNVTVKGSASGTVTDFDGRFSLPVERGDVLIFTYLGMQNVEMPASGSMVVVMRESNIGLEEVVVVGYGTQKKKDLTTSVSSVDANAIKSRPVIASAQALQGKAAGVQVVQTSGKPGGDITVRIRGNTSINASNEPLYVVDGVPMENISSVNPGDIESMTILKDASSAAIYGSRAANGVVIITTKRGEKGKAQINFSSYAGVSQLGKVIEALNTKEYYDYMDEKYGAGYVDRSNHHYTNWYKEAFRTGIQQNYQLSLSGGNEQTNYHVSGGFQDETGIVKPAFFQRASFRANIDSQLKEWVKLTANINAAKTDRRDTPDNNGASRGGVILAAINTPPFLTVWDPEKPGKYKSNPFEPRENPVGAASVYDLNTDYWFAGNVGLEFFITKGLTFRSNASVNYQNHQWNYFLDPEKTDYGIQNNGVGKATRDNELRWLNENILAYDANWKEKHHFAVMGGFSIEEKRYDNVYLEKFDYIRGLPGETPSSLNFANQIASGSTQKSAEGTRVSFLSRIHYSYDSKYLLTAIFRADASSKFAPGSRWGYFPSASMAWRLSSKPFFEPLNEAINDLKLRVGWGRTGNDTGFGDYDYISTYTMWVQDPASDTVSGRNKPGIGYGAPYTMSNPNLRWETTTQTNIGLDFSFLQSRITLTADAYRKVTTDLIMRLHLGLPGVRDPQRNVGEMLNQGFEFDISSRNLTGAFSWETQLNMSFNRNEFTKSYNNIVSYDGGIETNGDKITIIKAGLPMGSFFGFVAEGVDPETGDMIYADVDGDGDGLKSAPDAVDMGDRKVIGCAQPDFIYGMTNTFGYKDFTLSVFLQGSQGNDIFNASRIDTEGMTNSNNQSKAVLDRWQRPGMITTIPRSNSSDLTYNVRNSSRFVEDGSYLRLKTVTLSYRLPKRWISKIGLADANIYVTGNNLYTLTRYSGFDPEVNSNGGSATAM